MSKFRWSDELLMRNFTASEAESATGVTTSLQRQWAKRHFDFRLAPDDSLERPRLYWAGLQALMVFGEVMADLKDADRAQTITLGADQENVISYQAAIFEYDYRKREEGDLLIILPLEPGALYSGTVTAESLARLYHFENEGVRPKRAYVYNFSDMQRRLADQVGVRL